MENDLKINEILHNGSGYLNVKSLYVKLFGDIPNTIEFSYVNKRIKKLIKQELDPVCDKAYRSEYPGDDYERNVYRFSNYIIDMNGNEVNIYYNETNEIIQKVCELAKKSKFKEKNHLNLITTNSSGLDLKSIEIKKTNMELSKFYNDDFLEIDEIIRKRLNTKSDKGIVLLHGEPGTGKTSYLRYLIGKVKKRIMFLPSNLAHNITDPSFLSFLIHYPDSILVIEDAENVIKDRNTNNSTGSVSNLLNISDGLLSDCLNIQIICTFNSNINLIDEALMRKGRLIAKYEFGKLAQPKAQELSKHFGYDTEIKEAMTITEIINQDEKSYSNVKRAAMGFLK